MSQEIIRDTESVGEFHQSFEVIDNPRTRKRCSQLKRFENKAQLIRHIADETGEDTEVLWDKLDEEMEKLE